MLKLNRAGAGLLSTAAIALTLACGGTTTDQSLGPSATRCQISVASPPPSLPPSSSQLSLNVSTARDCVWTAVTDASWAVVSPGTGQGPGSVSLVVAANEQALPRTTALVVNDNRVPIAQSGVPCRYELSTHTVRSNEGGGRSTLRLAAPPGCEWRVGGSAPWVRIDTPSGAGAGEIELNVSRNSGDERSAAFTVADQSFMLIQSGHQPDPPPTPGPPSGPAACTFTIDPRLQDYGSGASTGAFRVTTASHCAWSASSSSGWIVLLSASGTGSGTVVYSIVPLAGGRDRSGGITVGGQTHTVIQHDGASN
jgi:hypothetical protein